MGLQPVTTNLQTASWSILGDKIHALRHELLKAQELSKIEQSINEAANAQLVLHDVQLNELKAIIEKSLWWKNVTISMFTSMVSKQ